MSRVPRFKYGLNRGASHLPGGMRTMMHLAWLSKNPKARAVAERWSALSADGKRNVVLEHLCEAAGIAGEELVAAVACTGFELGIGISPMLGAIAHQADEVARLAARAMTPGGYRAMEQFFEIDDVLGPWRR
jgi:hypothetical protein